MFKHSSDRISNGLIDLRQFWHNEKQRDGLRISINPDHVDQVLFTKTQSRFNLPGGREILFSVGIPTDKINFLLPVDYNRDFGWSEPLYKLEVHPLNLWDYPSYTRMETYEVLESNNNYWKILSIGFPDETKRWEVPKFKILTEEGDYRLSIYHSKSQVFASSDQLKDLTWVVSSYSQPIF